MAISHRHVRLTSHERRLRARLAVASRTGDTELAHRLRLEYQLSVARRRWAEYASLAAWIEAELASLERA